MKILLLSYSFGAGHGSEPGVGWNVAMGLAQKGHDVSVLTTTEFSSENQLALAKLEHPFKLYEFSEGITAFAHIKSYKKWQKDILPYLDSLLKKEFFDIVHQITFNSFRHIKFIAHCPRPFLIGPVGGAETVPSSLLRELPLAHFCKEVARYLPWDAQKLHQELKNKVTPYHILCSNPITQNLLRKVGVEEDKLSLRLPLALRKEEICPDSTPDLESPFFLYAGRITAQKGLCLLVEALSLLWHDGHQVPLRLIGVQSPKEERFLLSLQKKYHLPSEALLLHSFLPKEEVLSFMKKACACLYPALRDSGAMVVLEALACGTAPIFFDLPAQYWVPDGFGRKVAVSSQKNMVQGLAQEMKNALASPLFLDKDTNAQRVNFLEQYMTWNHQSDFFEATYKKLLSHQTEETQPFA